MSQLNMEDLQEKIGYGHGMTFGYTDDGVVWMSADSKDPEGKPIQSVYSWNIDQATKISASIMNNFTRFMGIYRR